jgi:glycosyltransferase involved in cell wall biosynthesis
VRLAYLSCDPGVRVFGGSGASVHVRETVRALRELGHEVVGFAPDLGLGEEVAEREGFTRVPLRGLAAEAGRLLERERTGRSDHVVREWRRLLYSEYAQRALRARLAAFRPDAIYERYSLFAYAGVELARELGCALLLEVNAPLSREAARYRELVLRHTAEGLEARILGAADALFVVSAELARHARELGVAAERILVQPNAVDPDRFHPELSGAALRARLGLASAHVVGFVGSLKPWHDLDTLCAALAGLHREDPAWRLLVVGEGPRLEALRGAGPFVLCTGPVGYEAVPEVLAAMDAVVVPYDKDGDVYFSPLKLFEAMAAARPVVGARVGQVAEILRDGENGLLYEPGQAADLAARLRELPARPDRGASLGAAARRDVLARHTWRANAERIVQRARACGAGGRPS